MDGILFEVSDEPLNTLIRGIFRKLPLTDRKHIESTIAAVTEMDLTTAVRPFAFGGKIVHELYFDTEKLVLFTKREKMGAIVSALIISMLADRYKGGKGGKEGRLPLSNQAVLTHGRLIVSSTKVGGMEEKLQPFPRELRFLRTNGDMIPPQTPPRSEVSFQIEFRSRRRRT